MPCNNCHKRHYVTSICRYFGGKKYDVYDCAFRVLLKPSQINVKITINFPARISLCQHFSRQNLLCLYISGNPGTGWLASSKFILVKFMCM